MFRDFLWKSDPLELHIPMPCLNMWEIICEYPSSQPGLQTGNEIISIAFGNNWTPFNNKI